MAEQIPPPEKKKPEEVDADAERDFGIEVGNSFPISEILAESRKNEKKEDALIDKNIKAGREAEVASTTLVGNAFANAKPLKERKNGNGKNVQNGAPTAIETGESKTIPPELEKIYGDKVPPEKLEMFRKLQSKEKRESYLAKLVADEEEKKKRQASKKPVKNKNKSKSGPKSEVRSAMESIKKHGLTFDLSESVPEAVSVDDPVEMNENKETTASEKKREFHSDGSEYVGFTEMPKMAANPEDAPDNIKNGTEDTRAGWKKQISDLIAQVEEKLSGAKEKVSEAYTASSEFLTARSGELGGRLKKFGFDVVGDFTTAGRGIARVAAHPIEALRSARSGAERAAKYAKYFADRSKTLDEKKEKLKVDMRGMIEGYNNLPLRYKTYITAALIGGSAVAAATGLPTLSSIIASGMYGTRALGGLGFALNRRKAMDAKIADNPDARYLDITVAGKSRLYKNTYAGVLGVAYMGVTALAGRYAIEKMTHWLGDVFGHGTSVATEVASPPNATEVASPPSGAGAIPHAAEAPVVAAPAHAPEVAATPTPVAEPPAAATVAGEASTPAAGVAPEVAPAAPEIAPIEAKAGDGYERMLQHLREQSKGMDPEKFPDGSDMRRLLEADPKSINDVLHDIAKDNEFLKLNETSVQINIGDKMTVTADGNIWVGEDIIASEGAHVTPAFHPEVPVTPVETPVVSTIPTHPVEPSYTQETIVTPEPIQPIVAPDYPLETAPPTSDTASPAPEVSSIPETSTRPALGEVNADFKVNALGLPVDVSHAGSYLDKLGNHIIFGGTAEDARALATEIVSKDHSAVVYFDQPRSGGIFGLSQEHHLSKTFFAGTGNEITPSSIVTGEPGNAVNINQILTVDDTVDPTLQGRNVPSIDDLKEIYKPKSK